MTLRETPSWVGWLTSATRIIERAKVSTSNRPMMNAVTRPQTAVQQASG